MTKLLSAFVTVSLFTGSLSASAADPALDMRIGMNPGRGRSAQAIGIYTDKSKQLRAGVMRLWFAVQGYSPNPNPASNGAPEWYPDRIEQIRRQINMYADAGLRVTLTVSGSDCYREIQKCPEFPEGETFRTYMKNLFAHIGPATVRKLHAIEVWNEVTHYYGYKTGGYRAPGVLRRVDRQADSAGYDKFSSREYVNNILIPGARAIKDFNANLANNANIKVYAGSLHAPNVHHIGEMITELKRLNALHFVDYFNFHPYVNSASEMAFNIDRVKSIIAPSGKGLVMTEWGCYSNQSTCIPGSMDIIFSRGVVEADYYVLAHDVAGRLNLFTETLDGPSNARNSRTQTSRYFDAFLSGVCIRRPTISSRCPDLVDQYNRATR